MTKEALLGLLRHLLTFGGGMAVTAGYVTDSEAAMIASGLVALAGAVWSIVEKRSRA